MSQGHDRRSFFKLVSTAGVATLIGTARTAWAIDRIENPLRTYPKRDWERAYRELYQHDSTFHFLCAPNDTHNCLIKSFVRSGVVTRHHAEHALRRSDRPAGQRDNAPLGSAHAARRARAHTALLRRPPPAPPDGARRFQALARRGFSAARRTGCPPRSTSTAGATPGCESPTTKPRRSRRRSLKNVAQTYTGEEGQKKLLEQHYDVSAIKATQGAGTQVLKFRGGMPLFGITRVFGMYRLANSMALARRARSARSARTRRSAREGLRQLLLAHRPAAGHPMVTGQQTVEFDLHSVEHARRSSCGA
jgi:nitrate reductase alpha subunit